MKNTSENIAAKVAAQTLPPELQKHFKKRTDAHIALVQKYCRRLEQSSPELKGLIARGEVHDDSKYNDPELLPYIWLTWRYKCKDDGKPCELPAGMEEKINQATEHHIMHNPHHPEYHQERKSGLLNTGDRDKPPTEMVNATKMSALDLAEMVADWCAMSEERGNTPHEWAKKNINVRWKFTPEQEKAVYAMMDACWGDK